MTTATPTGLNPFQMIPQALYAMANTGKKIAYYCADNAAYAAKQTVSTATMLVKKSEGAKNIALLATSIIDLAGYSGYSIARFATLTTSLKTFSEVVTARSIVGRVDEFTSGRAFGFQGNSWVPNVSKLASKISFLFYDTFGVLKFAEKVRLVSEGTGNSLAYKLIATPSLELGRSFFGYVGCGFSILDSGCTIYNRGLSWDTALSVSISTSRIVGFATPKGSFWNIASGGVTSLLCIIRMIKFQNE